MRIELDHSKAHSYIKTVIIFICLFSFTGCEKDEVPDYQEIDMVCSQIPSNWRCHIYYEDLDSIPTLVPHYLDQTAIAVVEFENIDIQYTQYGGKERYQSFILYYFDISDKDTLAYQTRCWQIYSSCVPMYFDETLNCYILANTCCYYDRWIDDEGVRYNKPLIDSLHSFFAGIRE